MLLMNIVYVFFLFICEYNVKSSKFETIKHCCGLGKNYAESGLVCDTFQPPIAGVTKDEEKFCLTSVKSCCKKQYREKQCQLGIEDARESSNCNSDGSDERKGCCDSCKIGLESSGDGSTCDFELGLEPLMNNAFKICCEKISTSSTTPVFTTSTTPIVTTQSSTTESNLDENSPGLPRLEGVCDIPEICAHLCIKEKDSYRCDCHKGYTLMADGVSCKLTAEVTVKNRCALHNPCEHECLDTGVAIKCLCDDGFQLAGDRRSCDDINECTLGIHDCRSDERCINTEGEYECVNSNSTYPAEKNDFLDKCPSGYMFNSEKMVCDDIDECELQLVCTDSSICINTIGSYKCEENNFPSCPPGFQFKDSIQDCADIDECITGENNCDPNTQFCLNSKGNYTCIDKSSTRACPAGFKKNLVTQLCEDINECAEIPNVCEENEECINEPGGHDCKPKSKSTTSSTSLKEGSSSTVTVTVTTTTLKPTNTKPFYNTNYLTPNPTTPLETFTKPTSQYQPIPSTSTPKRYQCPDGYQYSLEKGNCFDINECLQESQACDSNQDCYNTPGSFVCTCKNGFEEDPYTGACVDINECQIDHHDCGEGQRCDNSIGSYFCARVAGCGTGYTLNTATGLCEDDDECTLKTDNCRNLGPRYACRNIPGSYRCIQNPRVHTVITPNTTSTTRLPPTTSTIRTTLSSNVPPSFPIKYFGDLPLSKPSVINTFTVPINRSPTRNEGFPVRPVKQCLPGYKMNTQGQCIEIDECESSPCKKNEKCVNLQNAYRCMPTIHCRLGYELTEDGAECADINECARGLHKCKKSQICKNGPGYYLCHCPGGHKLNNQNECEDIDECEFYRGRICSANAICQNTVGSYKCICKPGFKEIENGCEDVNECNETPNLCHHTCINLWGSYRCACERGFSLNDDNRTCSDIDECEKFNDRKLCVGTCQNVPGSYTCKCPDGYRLGADGWTCQDIDECEQNPCPNPDDICFNVRGGFKCQTIQCPPRYIKDPEHKSHCRRASNVCDFNDYACLQMPTQYSYHFVTFVSNLPISSKGTIDFFQIKGPAWTSSTADFNMNLKNIRCPRHIKKADESYFKMTKGYNRAVIGIIKPIEGPQEMELQIQMQIFVQGNFQAKLISTIYIIVTEYPF